MPVEQAPGTDRRSVTHLEAIGRLLAGIAPWLELGEDGTDEGRLRARYADLARRDRKSTRLNSSHMSISYAVFCLKKKKKKQQMKYLLQLNTQILNYSGRHTCVSTQIYLMSSDYT